MATPTTEVITALGAVAGAIAGSSRSSQCSSLNAPLTIVGGFLQIDEFHGFGPSPSWFLICGNGMLLSAIKDA